MTGKSPSPILTTYFAGCILVISSVAMAIVSLSAFVNYRAWPPIAKTLLENEIAGVTPGMIAIAISALCSIPLILVASLLMQAMKSNLNHAVIAAVAMLVLALPIADSNAVRFLFSGPGTSPLAPLPYEHSLIIEKHNREHPSPSIVEPVNPPDPFILEEPRKHNPSSR